MIFPSSKACQTPPAPFQGAISLCQQGHAGRKSFSTTLSGGRFGVLQIKLTKDGLADEKLKFNQVVLLTYVWKFTDKCDSWKQLEIDLYTILIGEGNGEKGTSGKANDVLLNVERGESKEFMGKQMTFRKDS